MCTNVDTINDMECLSKKPIPPESSSPSNQKKRRIIKFKSNTVVFPTDKDSSDEKPEILTSELPSLETP